jgi:hypothetical protein
VHHVRHPQPSTSTASAIADPHVRHRDPALTDVTGRASAAGVYRRSRASNLAPMSGTGTPRHSWPSGAPCPAPSRHRAGKRGTEPPPCPAPGSPGSGNSDVRIAKEGPCLGVHGRPPSMSGTEPPSPAPLPRTPSRRAPGPAPRSHVRHRAPSLHHVRHRACLGVRGRPHSAPSLPGTARPCPAPSPEPRCPAPSPGTEPPLARWSEPSVPAHPSLRLSPHERQRSPEARSPRPSSKRASGPPETGPAANGHQRPAPPRWTPPQFGPKN